LNVRGTFMVMTTRPNLDQAIDTLKLICVDASCNSNKQWMGWVMPNGDLYVEYGRVGYEPKPHIYTCGSVRSAQAKLSRLMSEKQRKGYRLVPVEEAPRELDFSALAADEVEVIQRRLAGLQARSQQIGQFAQIRFDQNRGTFSTSMAVVTMRTIAQARQALRAVAAELPERDRVSTRFMEAVEDYLAILPLKVGMTLNPHQLLGTPELVRSQERLLDELALVLSEVREIRELIRSALGAVSNSGSDERARWLNWGGEHEEAIALDAVISSVDSGAERACWSRWTPGM
jgi:predicted DNA-binding WGR domain protein